MVERAPVEVIKSKIMKYEELMSKLNSMLQLLSATEKDIEETKVVLKELEKIPEDAELYKQVGFVLVPVKKEELVEELKKKLEELEMRKLTYEKMSNELKKDIERIAADIRKLQQGGTAVGG